MKLLPGEQEKLMIFTAAEVARRRCERGLKLNYPEAVAIVSAEILEGARWQERHRVDELRRDYLSRVRVFWRMSWNGGSGGCGGPFPDGVEFVTVHHPIT